jgi:hypothetical protein
VVACFLMHAYGLSATQALIALRQECGPLTQLHPSLNATLRRFTNHPSAASRHGRHLRRLRRLVTEGGSALCESDDDDGSRYVDGDEDDDDDDDNDDDILGDDVALQKISEATNEALQKLVAEEFRRGIPLTGLTGQAPLVDSATTGQVAPRQTSYRCLCGACVVTVDIAPNAIRQRKKQLAQLHHQKSFTDKAPDSPRSLPILPNGTLAARAVEDGLEIPGPELLLAQENLGLNRSSSVPHLSLHKVAASAMASMAADAVQLDFNIVSCKCSPLGGRHCAVHSGATTAASVQSKASPNLQSCAWTLSRLQHVYGVTVPSLEWLLVPAPRVVGAKTRTHRSTEVVDVVAEHAALTASLLRQGWLEPAHTTAPVDVGDSMGAATTTAAPVVSSEWRQYRCRDCQHVLLAVARSSNDDWSTWRVAIATTLEYSSDKGVDNIAHASAAGAVCVGSAGDLRPRLFFERLQGQFDI